MKMFFLIAKIFSTSFLFLYVTPNNSYTTEKPTFNDTINRIFDKLVITISGGDTESGTLLMTFNGNDGHRVAANKGQKIQWLLHPNNNVSEIIAIEEKSIANNFNIFSVNPGPVGGSKNWEGIISPDTDNPYEWYKIVWKDKDSIQHTDDPLIQVNPQGN
jgi:hypothetical protein